MNRFWNLKEKSSNEIKERLHTLYGDSSLSMATVGNWLKEFQRGRGLFLCSLARTPTENYAAGKHDFVLKDRFLKVHKTVGLSKNRDRHIVYSILGIRKLWERWVPPPQNTHSRERTS